MAWFRRKKDKHPPAEPPIAEPQPEEAAAPPDAAVAQPLPEPPEPPREAELPEPQEIPLTPPDEAAPPEEMATTPVELPPEPAPPLDLAEAEEEDWDDDIIDLVDEVSDEAPEAVAKKRRGLFRRLKERLGRTRQAMASRLDRLFLGKKVIDAELLDELEEILITADIGVETSLALIDVVQQKVRRRELTDPARLKDCLKEEIIAHLQAPPTPPAYVQPRVIMMVGVNGVGKTTTIAKLAYRNLRQGKKVLLVAADTFRAAAVEQLELWGERLGIEVIHQKAGADPAAVVFDGVAAALARNVDVVYIDTAGRLHTKINLMEELKKIRRTADKQMAGAPHDTYLVLDATTGQNAINQARMFHEAIGLTGLIVTKLDGTAKGGVVLGIAQETGLPLCFIGVGEQMSDLRPFVPEAFVEAILG